MRVASVVAISILAGLAVGATAHAAPKKKKAREPSALVLVIDRSGSMVGPKLDAAKQAAIASISSLHRNDQVAVIAFNTEAHTFAALQRSANRKQIAKEVERILGAGGTHINPGLEAAFAALRDLKARTKHVIVLSDGEAPHDGLRELIANMRTAKITVSTVAIPGADLSLLDMISDEGGGRTYRVTDLRKLTQVFVTETKLALQ
jgi:Ca-activated chloride channel homolog